jgi:UDP-glucose 4-epimerase
MTVLVIGGAGFIGSRMPQFADIAYRGAAASGR